MTTPDNPTTGVPPDIAAMPCLEAAAALLVAQLLPEIEAVLAEVAS